MAALIDSITMCMYVCVCVGGCGCDCVKVCGCDCVGVGGCTCVGAIAWVKVGVCRCGSLDG